MILEVELLHGLQHGTPAGRTDTFGGQFSKNGLENGKDGALQIKYMRIKKKPFARLNGGPIQVGRTKKEGPRRIGQTAGTVAAGRSKEAPINRGRRNPFEERSKDAPHHVAATGLWKAHGIDGFKPESKAIELKGRHFVRGRQLRPVV